MFLYLVNRREHSLLYALGILYTARYVSVLLCQFMGSFFHFSLQYPFFLFYLAGTVFYKTEYRYYGKNNTGSIKPVCLPERRYNMNIYCRPYRGPYPIVIRCLYTEHIFARRKLGIACKVPCGGQ